MSGIKFIRANEAEQRVGLIAKGVLDFLAEFNSTYPDIDARAVSSHFDYFTQSYVFQTCGSILSERLTMTPLELTGSNLDNLLQNSKDEIKAS